MSVLATSPTSIRVFDVNIANALGSSEAATILQQLHYWMKKKKIGIIAEGKKYVYNTFQSWVQQQFIYLTDGKFRRAMNLLRSLEIVEVIRYKSKEWNQTNYYSLNYARLREWGKSETIEISELPYMTDRGDETKPLEVSEIEVSIYESKKNTKEETAKQSDRPTNKSKSIAAATSKEALEGEKGQIDRNPHSAKLTASIGQKKVKSGATQSKPTEEKSSAQVDCIVNKNWKALIPSLDGVGVPINKTLKDLLKLYPAEKVENAIAIVKARKRDQYIPNLSGYFVSALKGDWASQDLVDQKGDRNSEEIDKGAVFRHWYDLGKQLGYCSGQEVRDGEQWVCLSGSWESWGSAIKRGYSLEYMKQIMKRNKRQ